VHTFPAADSWHYQLLLQAHMWLMAISWGVLMPIGIMMARSFKELDPLWLAVHRCENCRQTATGRDMALAGTTLAEFSTACA
jgi:hypothetical protein